MCGSESANDEVEGGEAEVIRHREGGFDNPLKQPTSTSLRASEEVVVKFFTTRRVYFELQQEFFVLGQE